MYQNEEGMGYYISHYGCMMVSLAFSRPYYGGTQWRPKEFVPFVTDALSLGIVSGDKNSDGDMDDAGEFEIKDPWRFCSLLKLPVEPIEGYRHFEPDYPVDANDFVLGEIFNKANNFSHFCVIHPLTNKIVFDPILGGSKTAKAGFLRTKRVFKAKAGFHAVL